MNAQFPPASLQEKEVSVKHNPAPAERRIDNNRPERPNRKQSASSEPAVRKKSPESRGSWLRDSHPT